MMDTLLELQVSEYRVWVFSPKKLRTFRLWMNQEMGGIKRLQRNRRRRSFRGCCLKANPQRSVLKFRCPKKSKTGRKLVALILHSFTVQFLCGEWIFFHRVSDDASNA